VRVNRLATLAAVVLSIAPTGCGLFGPDTSPEEVARRFLTAFASGDTAGAAANTDSADAAKALMDSVRAALKPAAVAAELDGVTITERDTLAVATFTVRWDLGHGRSWPYQGTLRLRPDDDAWKVQWAPAVLQPELAEQQSIALREQEPDFAPVLDRDSVPA